jgi:DNA-binding Lrp family transcriptional regulator
VYTHFSGQKNTIVIDRQEITTGFVGHVRKDFDLLVKFYVEPGTDIGQFVNQKVQSIPGIQDTRTIITYKAF